MSSAPSGLGRSLLTLKPSSPNRWTSGPAIVAYIAIALFAAHMLTASRYGLLMDELYFLACSEHLAWGFIDHPPLIALIAYIARHLFGESMLGLHILPSLAAAGLVWVVGCITRELGGGRFAQATSALAVALTPAYLLFLCSLTIMAFEPLVWAGCAYLFIKALRNGRFKDWILFGVLVGFGLELKYTLAIFAFSLFAGLLLSPSRWELRNWRPWAASGIALLILSPNLLWEYVHDFPFYKWQQHIRTLPGSERFDYSLATFFSKQAMFMLPAILLVLAGLWYFLASPIGKRFRYFGFAALIVTAICSRTGKPHYSLAIYSVLIAGGAILLEHRTDPTNLRWLRSVYTLVAVALGLVLAPCFLPVLPIERYVDYEHSLHLPLPIRMEDYEVQSEIPENFAWEFGWKEMVAGVAQTYNLLSDEEKKKVGILGGSYGEAGSVDLLGKKYGLPKAACTQLSYHDFGPTNLNQEVIIFIGPSPEDLARLCDSVQPGAYLANPYGYDGQRGPIINVCRGLHFDLVKHWREIQTY